MIVKGRGQSYRFYRGAPVRVAHATGARPQITFRSSNTIFSATAQVPADAYYGVHTLRALENFAITGTPISIYPDLVGALACVKQAAALANRELGLLDKKRCDAIVRACEEIRDGELHDEFVVDVIQGGAGTSTNMNANEVIANRGARTPGAPEGRVPVPASDRARQHEPEHQRRLSDRGEGRRCISASSGWSTRWRSCARRSRPRPRSSPTC